MRYATIVWAGLALVGMQGWALGQVKSPVEQGPGYFELDPASVKVVSEANPPGGPFGAQPSDIAPTVPPSVPIPGDSLDIGLILNVGTKLWEIISANKPVVEVATYTAAALPKGAVDWRQLSGWQPPEARTYGFSAKNVYGVTVINVKYQVVWTYGGGVDGAGRYLANVKVSPLLVEAAWGYKFSLGVEFAEPVNAGTGHDPVAGLQAALHWKVKTVMKESQGTSQYYVQGDGLFKSLGEAF